MFVPQKWLRLQFGRRLKRGLSQNAEVNPLPTDSVRQCAEVAEDFAVSVTAKSGARYWLTDRRMLVENGSNVCTVFRYEDVSQVHWMFKGWFQRAWKGENPAEEITKMKSAHFDRLEVELKGTGQLVVLEGLAQSYDAVFEFLKLLNRGN